MVSTWVFEEDVEEGEGEDVEVFFCFGEEHRERVFDLCFGL